MTRPTLDFVEESPRAHFYNWLADTATRVEDLLRVPPGPPYRMVEGNFDEGTDTGTITFSDAEGNYIAVDVRQANGAPDRDRDREVAYDGPEEGLHIEKPWEPLFTPAEWVEIEKRMINLIRVHADTEWKAAAWLLERLDPEAYGRA